MDASGSCGRYFLSCGTNPLSAKHNTPMSRRKQVDISPLVQFLNSIHPLTSEVEDYIQANCHAIRVKRGEHLLKAGEICDKYYFVMKGLLRAYIIFGNKEITTWMNTENQLVTSIRSMSNQEPAKESIQAVEDAELVVIPYATLAYLYENSVEINVIGRVILQVYYADAEARAFISRIPNAEMRYQHFIESRPDLVNRAPLKYIASYLGMTEETLSRLRSKKKKA
jgi:CRP-like cAMP-binding protein